LAAEMASEVCLGSAECASEWPLVALWWRSDDPLMTL
jgi:hypothetical protein